MTRQSNNPDQALESMSALMDNDWADDQPVDELLSQLQQPSAHQAQLRAKFERYHLIRDAMHKEVNMAVPADFSSRIAAAIADEPTIVSPAPMDRARVVNEADASQAFANGVTSEMATQTSVTSIDSIDSIETAQQPEAAQISVTGDEAKVPVSLDARRAAAKSAATAQSTSSAPKSGFWSSRWGGAAVAASAALVALLGFNVLEQQQAQTDGQSTQVASHVPAAGQSELNTQGAQVVLPETNNLVVHTSEGAAQGRALVNSFNQAPIEYVANTTTFWVQDGQESKRNSAAEQRLNMLLSKHIENSPTAGISGMLPYSRLAGYDTADATNSADDTATEPQQD